jgi:hypothetical protein
LSKGKIAYEEVTKSVEIAEIREKYFKYSGKFK